jgi:hypothetical protein
MMVFNRRVACFAAMTLFAIALAACVDDEPDQRKAFIEFLQTRIVDKRGVHVPKLSADETKSFGPYAAHFAVITDFSDNPELKGIGARMDQVMQKVSIRTVQEFVDHRAEFKTVMEDMGKLTETMNRLLVSTNAARAALKQPDDLKAIYDKAYERDVNAPVRGFNEVMPIVTEIAASSLKLGDYIDAHRSKVAMSDRSITGKDPQTAKELDALVKAVGAKGPRFQEAQQRLRVTLEGN